ncbi:MAG: glycine cleavage system protein GcvH [Acidobacteria bacterium]|nr:glycine cleavage system protein GcvH [Acidobacteriota bacterium]MBI3262468.1 glycine cleavage system protein GcvH [Acidobacteriota bacterium]
MMDPKNYRYTKDHEWIGIENGRGRVGITDYAQKQLGDVVYLELPPIGKTFERGQSFGTIESVKAVSELYSPMSGEVIEVNTVLVEHPEAVNTDPYQSWMIVLRLTKPDDTAQLLTTEQYAQLIK